MDYARIGAVIRARRLELHMTQRQLAEQMYLSDKTISKWERGLGCPDVSLLAVLSGMLQIDLEQLLSAREIQEQNTGGNMKKATYYVCPVCGNLSVCTGAAVVSCCGRKLTPLIPQKASEEQKLRVELVEQDWYLTSLHPMEKSNYIAFVAFVTGDKLLLYRQYPEWELSVRIPCRGHGTLLWYSTTAGLFYQYV